ncbi:PEP2-like protein [Colletotrichum tanaceti]|uniref:PEP2-like protein n=1 Tax=Colletotrichum tanaceti TaxID=1306861 RepID=A0A4U6XD65_9PEZI|nr:PEP2-like protein [Colletotrichum tanaceti]TKW53701.1 PEP2-like protein [Colletotrichum tanaceti]
MPEPRTSQHSYMGGTPVELLDRLAVSELCKGWPVYRDAGEWDKFRSLFNKDAYVWTTWSGAQPIDHFISISVIGQRAKGAFIMHRECGTLVELNPGTNRAVGTMKATITQRFKSQDGGEYDVDCDCRFMFFCEKNSSGERSDWKAAFVKLVYEKDKVVPVDGTCVPMFEAEVLAKYPEGYKYLGAAQSSLGYEIDIRLVTGKNPESCGKMHESMGRWLAGEQGTVGLFD